MYWCSLFHWRKGARGSGGRSGSGDNHIVNRVTLSVRWAVAGAGTGVDKRRSPVAVLSPESPQAGKCRYIPVWLVGPVRGRDGTRT